MANETPTDTEQFADDWAAGAEFQREVNEVFESLPGGVDSDEWRDYCSRMDV